MSKLYFGGIDTSRCGDAGVPDWGCGRLAPGAEPYLTQGQPLTDEKLSVQAKSVGSVAGRALVRVAVENGIGALFDRAFNELVERFVPGPFPIPDINFPTGPAINADLDITATYVGPRRVKVSIAGSHDGFPSYEVWRPANVCPHRVCSREMVGHVQPLTTAQDGHSDNTVGQHARRAQHLWGVQTGSQFAASMLQCLVVVALIPSRSIDNQGYIHVLLDA